MESRTYRVKGDVPLVVHNGRLANPLNAFSKDLKKLTSIKGKTDKVLEQIARCEWAGGMYTDSDGEPCIPGEVIEATVHGGAKKSKLGKQFLASVTCDGSSKIEFDGPRNLDDLYEDEDHRLSVMVKVGTSKVLRTRPKFDDWEVKFTLKYDPEIIQKDALDRAVVAAGTQCGLGTWRPKFGRFSVVDAIDGDGASKPKKKKRRTV